MLSILIPEYNCNCNTLVEELTKQCVNESIVFEILVMDDASTMFLEENRKISKLPGCQFIELKENQQSARTRNRLGEMATYSHLLFLDSDLEIPNDLFIRRYLDAIGSAPVLVGAVVYQSLKPPVNQMLRWKYGRNRESLPTIVRNRNPWKSFNSQNFMMDKTVFEKVRFDESFIEYGHEDTLLGVRLKMQGIPVLYIDNPLIHNGLETNEVFLTKSLIAVEKYLTLPVMQTKEVMEHIRIYRMYRLIKLVRLNRLIALKFRLFERIMRQMLCGPDPVLFVFDFYRLGHLCNVAVQKDRNGVE